MARYDRSAPLAIDPVLSYSTFLGGSGQTNPTAITLDSSGDAYVTGSTTTNDFPGTSGTGDLFVAELNPAGTGIVYITYFGSANNPLEPPHENTSGIALDGSGNAYVTGATDSSTFPVTPGTLEPTRIGYNDAGFVLRLGPGGQVVWGTYLGGSDSIANAITVDEAGNAYVAGAFALTNFPAASGTCASNDYAIAATLNPSGSTLLNATCIAGFLGVAIGLDPQSNIYVLGSTQTTNLPTTPGAFQGSPQPNATNGSAAVAKLTSGSISYLTYLDGTNGGVFPTSLAVDAAGNAYVGGATSSTDFPVTPGAFDPTDPTLPGNSSGFVTKLNPAGTALAWSTYLGGSYNSSVQAIAVDSSGNAYVAGTTWSASFPTTPGAIFSSVQLVGFNDDVFVTQLGADGSVLDYSGRMGSTANNQATAMARSAAGSLYITGNTASVNYPTTPGAYETTAPPPNRSWGLSWGYVTKVDMTSPTLCTVSLSSYGTEISGHGGSGSFNVTLPTGCPWEAVADLGIISPTSHGTSSGTVSFTVGANYNTISSATGHIYVGPDTYTIKQDSGSCGDPGFSPASLAFGDTGGFGTVTVGLPSQCPLNASVSDGWIQVVSGGNAFGSGGVVIFVAPNSFAQRSGTVTIAGKTITVNEDAGVCSASVVGPAASLPPSGVTGTFQIATSAPSCQWAVSNVPAWMQINMVSPTGQGSATLGFVAAPNATSIPRSATLDIAGQAVTVNQDAGPFGNRPDFYTASIFAGDGVGVYMGMGEGWPATSVPLPDPAGLAWRNGNLYIADQIYSRVRVVTPDGLMNTFSDEAGVPSGLPQALAFAADGTMYVTDSTAELPGTLPDGFVWKISNGTASAVAGGRTNGLDDLLSNPRGVAVDADGNVFIADTSNNRIREVSGGTIATVAGTGSCAFTGDNGPASAAGLCAPAGLAFGPDHSLFVADDGNGRVRMIAADGTITTFAGGGSESAPDTGTYQPATSVALRNPYQLALDPVGNLYFTDGPDVWRVISWNQSALSTPQITKLTGGTGGITFTPVNGSTAEDILDGVAAADTGDIYVSDIVHVWQLAPGYSFCSIGGQNPGPLALSPANGATGIVPNPILTWTTVSGAASYDVYLGASNPPPLAGNATCTSYSPQALANNTTYYWQVVPKGASGLVPSAVQSFTTQTQPFANSLKNVGSGADGFIATVAPNSIAAAYGNNLATATQNVTTLPLPTVVQGTTLALVDPTGKQELAPLFFVSGGAPDQVNFLVPSDMASGPATVIVTAQDGTVSQGSTNIVPVSPGMFELNSSGLAAAFVFDATTNTLSNVYQVSGGQIVPNPISLPASDNVFLELFGTGLRAAGQSNVSVVIGTTNVTVSYAGAQGSYEGLDQVNVALPSSLAGSGDVVVQLTANGIAANPVHVTIQ